MVKIEERGAEAVPGQPQTDSLSAKTCYVRPVLAGEVRDEIEREAENVTFSDDQLLYALHAADGSRIALMSTRAIAFAAAKQHEMAPLSVH